MPTYYVRLRVNSKYKFDKHVRAANAARAWFKAKAKYELLPAIRLESIWRRRK